MKLRKRLNLRKMQFSNQPSPSALETYSFGLGIGGLAIVTSTLSTRVLYVLNGSPHADPEIGDKIVWGAILLCAAMLLLVCLLSTQLFSKFARGRGWPNLAMMALLWGILWEERYWVPDLWYGFGNGALWGTIIAMPAVLWFLRTEPRQLVRPTAVISGLGLSLIYLPLLIQPPWGMGGMSLSHARYVINEVLAQSAGLQPFDNFVPQYANILGIPLSAIFWSFPALKTGPLTIIIATAYISFLSVIAVGALVLIAWSILPKWVRPLAPLIVVPLVLVKGYAKFSSEGALTAIMSSIPVRTLPLAIIGLVFALSRHIPLRYRAFILGLLSGLATLNNVEFGVVCLIASLGTVVFQAGIRRGALSIVFIHLGATATTFVTHAIYSAALGAKFDFSKSTLFMRSFWAGFDNVPMGIAGAQYFIVPILIAGVAIGASYLSNSVRELHSVDSGNPKFDAASVALFFGLAGLGAFGYFVGRSVVSTQLQIFLFFIAPIIASSVTLLLDRVNLAKTTTAVIVSTLPVALSLGVLAQAPDPAFEWKRILPHSSSEVSGGPYQDWLATVKNALMTAENRQPGITRNISFSIRDGNFLSIVTDISNVSTIDQPVEVWTLGRDIRREYCRGLNAAPGPILTSGFTSSTGGRACHGYHRVLKIDDQFEVIDRFSD